MGSGASAHSEDLENAREIGRFVGAKRWVLLTGGRNAGVMAAATAAAARENGLTLGFLPGDSHHGAAPHLALALPTGLGNARNAINVLASDVVVVCACKIGAGTLSETALAMKSGKPLIVITDSGETMAFFERFGYRRMFMAKSVSEATQHLVKEVETILSKDTFLPISTSES